MTTTTPQTIMMTMGVSHSATPTTTPRHGSGAVDVPSAMEKKEEGGVHRKTSDGVPRVEGAVGYINEEMALHRGGRALPLAPRTRSTGSWRAEWSS
mmetsp:Transcript_6738/g.20517  ORF Transcript_6738/g.20517 Transcript_6738/m.20517 type:complete len:96 (+) Transcript_6738:394-681(+)